MTIGLTEFISPKWIKPLYDKLVKLRGDRELELNNIGKLFRDPTELAQYYIQPHCQNINPADENEDDPVSVVTSPIFETLNKFLNGKFAHRGDGRSQMFVLADAGMGKTSLLLMLKLAHLTSFWPNDYECKILKLGKSSIEEIASISAPSKTVLLLDALDEDQLAWGNIRNRIIELLQNTSTFKRVIIVCRTQFFPNEEVDPFKRIGKIKVGGYICPMVFLSPFNDELVIKYLNKRFKCESERQKALNLINSMGSLRFRPLLLSYIDGFLDSQKQEWSEFDIFSTLITAWLMREENKLAQLGKSVSHNDLFLACLCIARIMHLSSSRTVNGIDFSKLKEENYELKYLEEIDLAGRSLLNRNSDGDYRFAHYSIQEFLVSYGVINGLFNIPNESLWITAKLAEFISKFRSPKSNLKVLQFAKANIAPETDFSRADLSGVNISDANFYSVNFIEANFQKSFGNDSIFSRAKLSNSQFDNSCIENAVFNYAICDGVSFVNANLLGTNFVGANLRNVNFTNCNLADAVFDGGMIDGAIFCGANLEGASFIGSTGDADFTNANLSDAIINQGKLTKGSQL